MCRDGISEASEDHMSTISIDNSAGHETDGDDDQAIEMNPAGIEAGVEIDLGFEAPGDGFLEAGGDSRLLMPCGQPQGDPEG